MQAFCVLHTSEVSEVMSRYSIIIKPTHSISGTFVIIGHLTWNAFRSWTDSGPLLDVYCTHAFTILRRQLMMVNLCSCSMVIFTAYKQFGEKCGPHF